jgi:hypothetical protein
LGEISPFGRIFKCLTDLGAIFCLKSPKFWLPFVFKILNLDKQSLGKNLYLVMLHFGRYFRQNWALFSQNVWSHCRGSVKRYLCELTEGIGRAERVTVVELVKKCPDA